MNLKDYIKDSHLKIRVTPNSKKTEIKGVKDNIILVSVHAPPENNKANLEIIKFFAKQLKKKVMIKKGLKSKNKILIVC